MSVGAGGVGVTSLTCDSLFVDGSNVELFFRQAELGRLADGALVADSFEPGVLSGGRVAGVVPVSLGAAGVDLSDAGVRGGVAAGGGAGALDFSHGITWDGASLVARSVSVAAADRSHDFVISATPGAPGSATVAGAGRSCVVGRGLTPAPVISIRASPTSPGVDFSATASRSARVRCVRFRLYGSGCRPMLPEEVFMGVGAAASVDVATPDSAFASGTVSLADPWASGVPPGAYVALAVCEDSEGNISRVGTLPLSM